MSRPFLSAKIQTSDPGRKSGQCLLSSPMPPVFRAMDRNPSLYVHSDIGSQCRNGGGIRLKCSLNGVSSVTFIVCSVEWVHPNSVGSNENMS